MSLDFDLERMRLIEKSYVLWDDFSDALSSSFVVGETAWTLSAVGTPATLSVQVAGRIGVKRVQTGSKTNDTTSVWRETSYDMDQPKHIMLCSVKWNHTSQITKRIGYLNTSTGDPTAGAYFEKLNTDTNWFAVTFNSPTKVRTDTGIADDTAWHSFRFYKTGSEWLFFIDGGLKATHSGASLPTGISFTPNFQQKTTDANGKSMDIDYCTLSVIGLSR